MNEPKTPETFEQKMTRLGEKADEISGALNTLLACRQAGNLKQVAYWVGKVSHDVSDLCRECLGEELLKKIEFREKGIIR